MNPVERDKTVRHDDRETSTNVISFLEHHRRERPEKKALLWAVSDGPGEMPTGHAGMTFANLGDAVESAAAGLADMGLRQGDRAFIFLPMTPQLYIAMFAVQRLGAVAVFLDSWARRDQLALCARQVEPRAFIGLPAAFELTAGVPELADLPVEVVAGGDGQRGADLLELARRGGRIPMAAVAREETALVTFTTGSSGPPKGADRTHRFLASQHRALTRSLPYREDDIDLPVFPVFSLNNLAGGVTTLLPAVNLAQPSPQDGAVLVRQLSEGGATCATLSPSLLRAVASAGSSSDLRRLRRIATGGAPITPQDVKAIHAAAPAAELHILYGSTEVEPIAHLVAARGGDGERGEGVCVGTIVEGLRYRFIALNKGPVKLGGEGWSSLEVPAAEGGELVVSGDHVCRGYFRNEEAFARAKIVDGDGEIWHRTGDVGRLDGEGRLWLLGRVHNAICRREEILFPVGPETIMKTLPFVQGAAYVGLPDGPGEERAVAAFSCREGHGEEDPAGTVQRALREKGVVVDETVELKSIPLDPRHHSKVEYAALRALLLEERGEG